jgi:tripartite-type tricarboxylate transporter receptor subunit TctC
MYFDCALVRLKPIVLLLACAGISGVHAQQYPTKPIRVIVPSSPGGGLDFVSRAVGQQITAAWGQSVVVDNRAGAGGTLGPELVARAAPDGYTLLIVSATFAVNPSAYPKLPYDTLKDFAPITLATTQPQVMVVHPSIAARSAKELAALAKAKPGQLNYSSPGDGTLSQLAFELFKLTSGVNVVQIPYKGAGLSMTAAVAGEVQASSGSVVTMLPHVTSGRLRAIASTGKGRSAALPDVLTMTEQGLPEATISGWYAFLAPARTPAEIVQKLNTELGRILQTKEMREILAREGSEPAVSTPEQLNAHIADEVARLSRIVKASRAGKS